MGNLMFIAIRRIAQGPETSYERQYYVIRNANILAIHEAGISLDIRCQVPSTLYMVGIEVSPRVSADGTKKLDCRPNQTRHFLMQSSLCHGSVETGVGS